MKKKTVSEKKETGLINELKDMIYYIFNYNSKKNKYALQRSEYLKKIFENSKKDDDEIQFYEAYIEEDSSDLDINLDELLYDKPSQGVMGAYASSFSDFVTKTSIFPSRRDYQYAGIDDERLYFLKAIMTSIIVSVFLIVFETVFGNFIGGVLNGLTFFILIMLGSIFYPKIKLTLFKGEIKIQILMTLLHIISMLNSGASVQESIKNIADNPEYGIPSYEFRNIIKDINNGGYSFEGALERARTRTKVNLMKELYSQLIISSSKGGTQLLLENLYKDIVRSSMSKIDSAKFQIGNLGNLVFGAGLILPFAGLLQASLGGQQGYDGVINAVELVLFKIGPLSTIVFGIFIKMKIE
ncbi:type II secretion system F family protein [Methanococcus voltae]|uniref:Type II secretion system F domain protein n=1 Tax=Methanococcus voltae (strain ATCC BAA-1334 / A3) TaxID=456320 RepID=D7DV88_METV3|nr:type II secretion system F family protein [Methanococcus voltae]MCS3901909.1 flagellar protein FlaJ [Methanococcus voltae]